jgi:hypothetical protein
MAAAAVGDREWRRQQTLACHSWEEKGKSVREGLTGCKGRPGYMEWQVFRKYEEV